MARLIGRGGSNGASTPGQADDAEPPLAREGLSAAALALTPPSSLDAPHATPVLPADAAGPPRRIKLPRTFDSLFEREFRWYYISMLGNMSAMNMQLVLRALLAYVLTGSYAALGLIGLAGAIPTLTLSVFGGVIADRLPKKTVMQVGQTASAANAAVLAGLYFADLMTIEWLLASAFAHGVTTALMMPSRQAMIPDVVPPDRMMNAVSLNMAGMNSMRLFAPALGGFIVALFGFGWAFLTMAFLFTLAVIAMSQVKWRPAAAPGAADQSPWAVAKSSVVDIGSGLAYLGRDRRMFILLTVAFVTSLFGMPLQFMLPAYVADIFAENTGEAGAMAGLLLSVSAVGALVGALTLASFSVHHRGWLFIAGAVILGVGTFLFAQTLTFWVAGLAMLIVGLGSSMRQALSQGLLHAYVDPAYRGRVMAIFMMQMSVMQLGTFAVGIAAESLGIRFVVASLGVLLIGVTLLYAALSPTLRRMD